MCGPVQYDQDYNLFSFCIYGEDEFRTLNACEICVPCSVLTRSMPPPVFPPSSCNKYSKSIFRLLSSSTKTSKYSNAIHLDSV